MGAVSVDIHRGEREFKNLTLSDENVVKYLIQYRSKVDLLYSANMNINIEQAGDMFEFNQELIALYASLDSIISECRFKEKQLLLLELLFEGNTLSDICRMKKGFKKSATYDLLSRMVAKIVMVNNRKWLETMEKIGYIK